MLLDGVGIKFLADAGVVEEPENGTGSSLDARLGKGEGSINMKSFSGDVSVMRDL